MNCLYGKFGQGAFGRTTLCNASEYRQIKKDKGSDINNVKVIPGGLDTKYDDLFIVSTFNYASIVNSIGNLKFIASYITASARTSLFDMAYEAGSKNVYYVDTDSCYYKGKRIGKIDPSKLGWRDSEIDESKKGGNVIVTCAVFNAPKFYGATGFKRKGIDWIPMGDKLKSKGIKKGMISFKQFEELNNGSIESVSVKSYNFNRKMLESKVKVTEMDKSVKCVYSKREFIWNGNSLMHP
jgi:hypothetical protein